MISQIRRNYVHSIAKGSPDLHLHKDARFQKGQILTYLILVDQPTYLVMNHDGESKNSATMSDMNELLSLTPQLPPTTFRLQSPRRLSISNKTAKSSESWHGFHRRNYTTTSGKTIYTIKFLNQCTVGAQTSITWTQSSPSN